MVLAVGGAATGQQAPPPPQGSIDHLLDRIGEAKCESILLEARPLGDLHLDLDATTPERVQDDGGTRLWRLDGSLTRGPDGRPVAPRITLAGQPPSDEVKAEVVPSRVEVLFKDHPDFKDYKNFPRASDVHGNRYICLDEDQEVAFPIDLPGFPCRLALATKVLGTHGDFEAVGEAPKFELFAGEQQLGSFDASWKLNENQFDLPDGAASLTIKIRVSGVTPVKGGIALLRSYALVARDGCDRLRVHAPPAMRELAADYTLAPPPSVQTLFDYSLDRADHNEASARLLLLPGRAAVIGDGTQDAEVVVDGQVVGRIRANAKEAGFSTVRLGSATVALRSKKPLRGVVRLVQPNALYVRLRDPMASLRDPVPFVRGLEATVANPLVRHLMVKDDTHLALLAPVTTTVELPITVCKGDRFEVATGMVQLTDENLTRGKIHGEVVFIAENGTRMRLAEADCMRKKKVEWETQVAEFPDAVVGKGTLRFESRAEAGTQLSAFDAMVAFGDPVLIHAAGPRRPNLVVYLMDTVRADHCSPWSYARDTTPFMKRLADEGIVFEQAFSQAPWTRPSVATLFTSYLPSFHGASKMTGLAPQLITLAERLRNAGYATAGFLANAHVHGGSLNFEQGFSRFEAIENAKQRGDSRADAVQESALSWVDANSDRPFFLYVHTIDPHAPYNPPAATAGVWSGAYDGSIEPLRTNARELSDRAKGGSFDAADLQYLLDLYDEEILFNDREFGALCEHLREKGLWDDTIVVVVSDHGEEFFDHGGFGHGTVLWNELLHVPLIVKPDRKPGDQGDTERGVHVKDRVRVMDLPQTLLARMGVDAPPAEFMGVDLAAAFKGGELDELPVIAEEFPDKKCLLTGNWKWIWYGPKCRKQRMWLFDLATDPGELHDLSEERSDFCLRLQGVIQGIYRDYEKHGFEHYDNVIREHLDAQDREALDNLGYIAGDDPDATDEDADDPKDAKEKQRGGNGH